MNLELDKMRCNECFSKFLKSERLEAEHPFENGYCYGCPKCRSIDCFSVLCDEPGCDQEASCGTPISADFYRHTCGRHLPKMNKLNKAE